MEALVVDNSEEDVREDILVDDSGKDMRREMLAVDDPEEVVSEESLVADDREEQEQETSEERGDPQTLMIEEVEMTSTVNDALNVGIPTVITHSDVDTLTGEVEQDSTLKTCRKLADKSARGFYWLNSQLFC